MAKTITLKVGLQYKIREKNEGEKDNESGFLLRDIPSQTPAGNNTATYTETNAAGEETLHGTHVTNASKLWSSPVWHSKRFRPIRMHDLVHAQQQTSGQSAVKKRVVKITHKY